MSIVIKPPRTEKKATPNKEESKGFFARFVDGWEAKNSRQKAEAAIHKLVEQEARLQQKIELIETKEQEFLKKEQELTMLKQQIQDQRDAMQSEQAEYQKMLSKKPELEKIIERAKTAKEEVDRIEAKLRQVEMEQMQVDAAREDLERKAAVVEELAKEAGMRNKQLDDKEEEIKQRSHVLEEKELSLRVLEKACDLAKKDLLTTQHEVQQELEVLESRCPVLEGSFEQKKRLIESMTKTIQRENEKTSSIISRETEELKTRRREVVRAAEEMKQDRKRLENEEEIIIQKVEDLESERKQVQNMQTLLKSREADIRQMESDLVKEQRKLQQETYSIECEREKLEEAKKGQLSVDELKKEYNRLQKLIKTASKQVVEHAKKLPPEKASRIVAPVLEAKAESKPRTEDAHASLEKAQKAFLNNEYQKALDLVTEAEASIANVRDEDEKRSLEYSLKELRTSIRIGML